MVKEISNKKAVEERNKKSSEECDDEQCPFHGTLRTRGRKFIGTVVRLFPRRIAIEFDRFVYVPKYERYEKRRTRIHARLPKCMQKKIKKGMDVIVQECRPLSKMIHHVVVGIVNRK